MASRKRPIGGIPRQMTIGKIVLTEGKRAEYLPLLLSFKRMCTANIAPTFIAEVLPKTNILFLAQETETKTTRMSQRVVINYVGFALVTIVNSETWKIQLLCAQSGYGKPLMTKIEAEAAKQGITRITLDALSNVISYYRRFGFLNSETCDENPEVTALAQELKQMDRHDIEKDLHYQRFLQKLIDEKRTVDKDCTGFSIDYVQYPKSCSYNGYPMTKCLSTHASKRQRSELPPVS